MPRVVWDEATFHGIYQVRCRDPADPNHQQVLGYTRYGMRYAGHPYPNRLSPDAPLPLYVRRWDFLTSAFSIPTTERVLIAGAGKGWLVEAAHDAGWPLVYGVDNSPYVIADRNSESLPGRTEVRGDVILVERDFTGGGAVKAAFNQETGDREFHWIISEDVATSLEDSELGGALNAAVYFQYPSEPESKIIHMTHVAYPGAPTGDIALNWHTLQEWRDMAVALGYNHVWVDISTFEWMV